MLKILTLFLILSLSSVISSGQSNLKQISDDIVAEGKMLYKSERASWLGTDIFLEEYNNKQDVIGGYFSYKEDDGMKCIFYSNAKHPKVIGTFSFDSSFSTENTKIDNQERDFTKLEKEYYTLRKRTVKEVERDTLFKNYKNTNLNLIPLIGKNERKVFIITGPQIDGVVIFGNDYLLNFDNKNRLLNKKQLHNNIIITNYNEENNDSLKAIGAMHNHIFPTDDFITSTDICTLMLYAEYAGWEKYIVVSKDYLSIWNCLRNSLIIVPKSEWNKMEED